MRLLIHQGRYYTPEGLHWCLFRWFVSGFMLMQDCAVLSSSCVCELTCPVCLAWESLCLVILPHRNLIVRSLMFHQCKEHVAVVCMPRTRFQMRVSIAVVIHKSLIFVSDLFLNFQPQLFWHFSYNVVHLFFLTDLWKAGILRERWQNTD